MMADWSPSGHQADRAHGGRAARLQLVHDLVLALADFEGQLLEGDDAVVHDHEAHDVTAGADRQVHEGQAVADPSAPAARPRAAPGMTGRSRGSAS